MREAVRQVAKKELSTAEQMMHTLDELLVDKVLVFLGKQIEIRYKMSISPTTKVRELFCLTQGIILYKIVAILDK